MSRRKIHIWKRFLNYQGEKELFEAQCGRHISRPARSYGTVPMKDDPGKATCMHCVKTVLWWAAYGVERDGAIVRKASQHLDHLRRMKSRQSRKQQT